MTGFKWIANRALEVMASGKTVLFGFEEAIGFMVGVQVLDKDGISAGVKMCELACYLAKQGKTVNDKLLEIYKQYGYHVSLNSYYICHEQSTIKKIFERLRNFYGPNTVRIFPFCILVFLLLMQFMLCYIFDSFGLFMLKKTKSRTDRNILFIHCVFCLLKPTFFIFWQGMTGEVKSGREGVDFR